MKETNIIALSICWGENANVPRQDKSHYFSGHFPDFMLSPRPPLNFPTRQRFFQSFFTRKVATSARRFFRWSKSQKAPAAGEYAAYSYLCVWCHNLERSAAPPDNCTASTRTHSLRYSRRSHTFCKAFNNRAAYACVNAVLFTVLSLLLPTS